MTLTFEGPSGLRVIARANHANPITAVSACFLGGLPWESEAEQGITNLTQRLLLRGTASRHREEIADQLEFLGAAFSPFAYKDLFGASLSLLSRNFGRGLEILADCLRRPAFDSLELDKEKRLVHLELDRLRDDSLRYGGEMVERLLYDGHPYRHLVQGTPETVHVLSPEALRSWHARTFSPSRLVIAVVGDLRPEDVQDEVTRAFGQWDQTPFEPPEWPCWTPPQTLRREDLARDKRQAVVVVAQAGPSFLSDDYVAFQLLNTVLSGMSGRLFTELRDRRGLGYLVNSQLERRVQHSCLKAYLGTHASKLEEGLEAIRAELDRLRHEPVAQEELYRAKRYLLGLFEIKMQRKSYEAYQLAYHLSVGSDLLRFDTFPDAVRAVTTERLMEVAQRYLDPDGLACVTILPS